ncbi:MAG: hydroxyacylglutathione hydrolase [Pseudomonadota bacterium]
MATQFHQFPYLSDNYGVLVRDTASGRTACVDAGAAGAVFDALDATGWELDELWITHWHHDHTDGLDAVRDATGCSVTGPTFKGGLSFAFDRRLTDGDEFHLGETRVAAWHTPGHTHDMINYYLPDDGVIFTGDTLFAMGCGRVFEGTHLDMYESMEKLRRLPPETRVYGGHEYTQANARFALSVDPENEALKARAQEVDALRAAGKATLPTTMAAEFATNPFLRYGDKALRAALGMTDATDEAVFSELRSRKDSF